MSFRSLQVPPTLSLLAHMISPGLHLDGFIHLSHEAHTHLSEKTKTFFIFKEKKQKRKKWGKDAIYFQDLLERREKGGKRDLKTTGLQGALVQQKMSQSQTASVSVWKHIPPPF